MSTNIPIAEIFERYPTQPIQVGIEGVSEME